VSDIFSEVDEDLRRERLREIWTRYGNLIVAAACVVVLGVGGWRGYEWWQAKQAAENGARFETAMTLVKDGKPAEAEAAFSKIATEGASGYRMLARLQEASALAKKDSAAAVKSYDLIVADGGATATIQDLARVRAGLLLIDTASFADLRTRIEPATAADRPFRHSAREILAFAAWHAGDSDEARKWSEMIMGDRQSPASVRTRIEMLGALIQPEAKS
jgi:hypothetical protein